MPLITNALTRHRAGTSAAAVSRACHVRALAEWRILPRAAAAVPLGLGLHFVAFYVFQRSHWQGAVAAAAAAAAADKNHVLRFPQPCTPLPFLSLTSAPPGRLLHPRAFR